MGKLTDLRHGVNYIGIAIRWVLHDGRGNVLLMKRGPKSRDEQGAWEFGGGSVEFDETIEAAIARELSEELRSKPLGIKFLSMYEVHRVTPEGEPTHWINLLHAVRVDTKKIEIGEPEKIAAIGWFNTSNLPSPLHSQFHKSLAVAKAEGIIS